MIDITHAAELAGFLKTAGEMGKAMIGIRDGAILQAKVIELNGIILSAQGSALVSNQDQFALLDRVRQLEKEIASLEAWDAEKKRYELKKIGKAGFAYVLKKEAGNTEPAHAICANCYGKNVKSILQFNGKQVIYDQSFDCPSCKTKFSIMKNEMAIALGDNG
jgi:hypothetical protein